MSKMTREEKHSLASAAAKSRWNKVKNQAVVVEAGIEHPREDDGVLAARWPGVLNIGGVDIPVYVLSDGQRVLARIAATEALTGVKRQGDLESYLRIGSVKDFINPDSVIARMVPFRLKDVEMLPQEVKGLPSDLFIEICQGYVAALNASMDKKSGVKLSARQQQIAVKAGMFLAACAKVGLDALIDEATGYQYDRAEDALREKVKLYIAEDMRKWEKTFPDQLWEQFGRLTSWTGSIHSRPKYWGNLVMEFIYENLDPDVAEWLRKNAPAPRHGQNYHQWLTAQYGLKKLIEHIWRVIGVASTCITLDELRKHLQRIYGDNAAFHYAVKIVNRSEDVGQTLLFDPRKEKLQ
jgi:hypothetical protein